jgi:hypothetical protein
VPIVLKSGNIDLLEPSGHVLVCNGTALPVTLKDSYVILLIKILFFRLYIKESKTAIFTIALY